MAVEITTPDGVKVTVIRGEARRQGFAIFEGPKIMRVTDLNGHYVDVLLTDADRDTLVHLLER